MTLAEAQAQLAAWEAASLAVAQGRSYTIGDRQLTRESAAEIRNMISFFERRVNALTAKANGSSNSGVTLARWS